MVRGVAKTGSGRRSAWLAKLSPPTADNLVGRPKLFTEIDHARSIGRHVWVVAPAGSGKTSLLASYCAASNVHPVWYRVDEGDADPATFLHFMVRALEDRHLCEPEERARWEQRIVDRQAQHRALVRDLLDRLPANGMVVLDDYHAVPMACALHSLIAIILEEARSDIAVCILSRTLPAGALVRPFAAAILISRNDLLLSVEEARQLAVRRRIDDVATVDQAHTLSKGWPTAFLLLLATGRLRIAPMDSLDSTRMVSEFFAAEVFAQLALDESDVLLKTAFLASVTVQAAERLTGRGDATDILRRLSERQLFVDRLAGADAYLYHPLLRVFLMQKVSMTMAPESVTALKLASAQVLEESGEYAEIPRLLSSCQAWERLTAFIERNAERMIAEGRSATVENCVRLLPIEVLARSAWCRYWLGASLMVRDPASAYAQFESTARQMADSGDTPGASDACRAALDALFWEGGASEAQRPRSVGGIIGSVLSMAQRVMPGVSGLHFGGFALVVAVPAHPATRRLVEQAHRLYATSDNPTLRVQAANMLVAWHNIRGDHPLASSIVSEAESLGDCEDIPAAIRVLWLTGVAMQRWYIEGDPPGALAIIPRGVAIVRKHQTVGEHFLLSQAACALAHAGDLVAATQLLDRMRRVSGFRTKVDASHENYVEAAICMRRGDLPAAVALFRQSVARLDKTVFAAFCAQHRLGLIQSLLAAKDYSSALTEIHAVYAFSKRAESAWFLWQSRMAEAEALFGLNRDEEAEQVLSKALVLGREKGILALPLARPTELAVLLDRALALQIEPDYAQRLIVRHRLQAPEAASDHWPWRVRIYTLGRFQLVVDNEPVQFGRKAQKRPLQLLQAIIANGGRNVAAGAVEEALWPDSDGDLSERALSVTLSRLRRLLGDAPVIHLENQKLWLDKALCWTDLGAIELSLSRLESGVAFGTPASLETVATVALRVLALYQGPFLAGEGEEHWILAKRTRLAGRVGRALLTGAKALQDAGRQAQAGFVCTQLVERDPSVLASYPGWARSLVEAYPSGAQPGRRHRLPSYGRAIEQERSNSRA